MPASKFAFKMIINYGSIRTVTAYYVDKTYGHNQHDFKVVGITMAFLDDPITYHTYNEFKDRWVCSDHIVEWLSYAALDTRRRRVKTYQVERVLVKNIEEELKTLKKELFIKTL